MVYSKRKKQALLEKKRSLRGLVANTAGLTPAQAEGAVTALLDNGISEDDIEILPLGRRSCVIYWTGLEWDEITSPEDLKDMASRKYAANRGKRTSGSKTGITRTEAKRLADSLAGDFDTRVVSVGGGKYAVEVKSEHDYPVRITSESQLRMVANRGRSGGKVTTRAEADAIAREIRGDFDGVRVVKSGRGYAVEFLDDAGWPARISNLDQLRMVANRGRSGRKATTRAEADAIARELREEFDGVRVAKSGRGYVVEFLDDEGWPARISNLDQLRMVANGMRPNFLFGGGKGKAPVDTSAMSKEEFIRHMGKDREWREAYSGIRSDFAMRDANPAFKRLTKDQIEVMVEEKIADARERRKIAQDRAARGMVPNKWTPKPPRKHRPSTKKMKTVEQLIHEAERDKYPFDYAVRNSRGADHKEEIVEGIVCGLWPDTPEVEYDPEALKVAADFYVAVGQLSQMKLSDYYARLPRKRATPKEFGYYLAMQASGQGVSYWDDYDGVDGVPLYLPDVETHDTGEDLFFSWDPKRLKSLVWGG